MSSWKKATKTNQKTHRERSQPAARANLGILEKKKDYKLRAQDKADKQETLKLLRKKALNKNPDEFYHHMINSKIQKGEHYEKDKNEDLSGDQIKLMETQDIKYITMKRTIEKRKIERLQSQLHQIDTSNKTKNRHYFFVENEKEAKKFDVAKRLNTDPSMIAVKSNRPKLDKSSSNLSEEMVKKLEAEKQKSYKELENRKKREKELAKVQRKLQLKGISKKQRKVLKPKEVRLCQKSSAEIFKFKYERKK
jgi:U3 small nucleolar RNA-associated protein 11